MFKSTTALAAALLCALNFLAAPTHAQDKGNRDTPKPVAPEKLFDLMVGDPAPRMAVKSWVKGTAVSSFEKGKTYVVEFWATWCGPCRKSIPHLTEMAKKYEGKVTFCGISVFESDPAAVEPFVTKMGEQMAYNVATDDVAAGDERGRNGKMALSWMEASGMSGIPTAFVVHDGKIAWIGHPMVELSETLEQVVAGKWDLAAQTAKYAEEAKPRALEAKFQKAMKAKDGKAALAAIDALLAAYPDRAEALAIQRFGVLLSPCNDFEQAYAYADKLVDGLYNKSASHLNGIAWMIVDPQGKIERKDLKLAMKAAQRAVELLKDGDQEMAATLDTLARVYAVSGDNAKAREIQERAIGLCKNEQMKAELQRTLEEYRKAAQS